MNLFLKVMNTRRLRVGLGSALLTFALLPAALAAADDPALLVKTKACFVHALPAWPAPTGDHVERVVARGHEPLHTARSSGKMTRLLPITGTVAINTRRISYRVTRILGIAADAERLYVLRWASGRLFDRPPTEGEAIPGGRFELRVFWLGDGTELATRALGAAGWPAAAPEASLGKGPLTKVTDSVSCFGTTLRYRGRAIREGD